MPASRGGGLCAAALPPGVSTYAFWMDNQPVVTLAGTWQGLGAARELAPGRSPVTGGVCAREGLPAAGRFACILVCLE